MLGQGAAAVGELREPGVVRLHVEQPPLVLRGRGRHAGHLVVAAGERAGAGATASRHPNVSGRRRRAGDPERPGVGALDRDVHLDRRAGGLERALEAVRTRRPARATRWSSATTSTRYGRPSPAASRASLATWWRRSEVTKTSAPLAADGVEQAVARAAADRDAGDLAHRVAGDADPLRRARQGLRDEHRELAQRGGRGEPADPADARGGRTTRASS